MRVLRQLLLLLLLGQRGRRLVLGRSRGIGVGQRTTTTAQAGEGGYTPQQMMKIVEPGAVLCYGLDCSRLAFLSCFFLLLGTHIAFIDSSTSYSHPFIIHPSNPIHSHQSHPVSNLSHLTRGRRHWQFRDPSSSHVVFFFFSFFYSMFAIAVHSYLTECFLPRRSPLFLDSHTTHSGVSLMRIRVYVLG